MAAARSMRAISAASFTSRSASTALEVATSRPAPSRSAQVRCALQLTLSASRPMRAIAGGVASSGLGRLALLRRRADGDVDLRGRAGFVDLLGRLRAVAAVGGEQRAGRG